MIIEDNFLPEYCYSQRRNVPYGEVIHWFSASGIDKEKKFDPDLIYKLLCDMNLELEERKHNIYFDKRWPGSYQYMVHRNGVIWRLIPEEKKSYHAGLSKGIDGREYLNTKTNGTAWVGGKGVKFTEDQYRAGGQLSKYLKDKYDYSTDFIQGHDAVRSAWNIAHPEKRGGNKYDPGPLFDWGRHLMEVL